MVLENIFEVFILRAFSLGGACLIFELEVLAHVVIVPGSFWAYLASQKASHDRTIT